MPQRAPPSRPFASAPNRAGPTQLFASVPKSLPTLAQEACPRRAANEPWEIGTDGGVGLNNAVAHRAAGRVRQGSNIPCQNQKSQIRT